MRSAEPSGLEVQPLNTSADAQSRLLLKITPEGRKLLKLAASRKVRRSCHKSRACAFLSDVPCLLPISTLQDLDETLRREAADWEGRTEAPWRLLAQLCATLREKGTSFAKPGLTFASTAYHTSAARR